MRCQQNRKHAQEKLWPSGPVQKFLSGNLDTLFFGDNNGEEGGGGGILALTQWTKQFGRTYGIRCGQTNVLITSELTIVHEVLTTKFDHFHARLLGPIVGNIDRTKWVHLFNARGARWKRLRAIAMPAFSVGNLKKIMPTIDDSVKVMIGLLKQSHQRNPNASINIHDFFVEMAFDVIARVVMGQQGTRQFANSDAQLAVHAIQRFNNNVFDYCAWIFPWFGRNVLHSWMAWSSRWRNDPIGKFASKITHSVLERKKQREEEERIAVAAVDDDEQHEEEELTQQQQHKDLIDILLDSESECVEMRLCSKNGKFNHVIERIERKICVEEVVMQCFLFVLSGFDTTASSLSQVCHWLAWNPEVQNIVQEEIDTMFDNAANTNGVDSDEQMPSYEQLNNLKYTEAVIKEALRLSPRVITRECCMETTLGGSAEYLLEKGDGVQVDVMSLHRDKRVWGENADQFVPERWMSENVPSYAYYAFGAGPRMCLGMRMAMLENKLALARLLRKFSLKRSAETKKKIEFTGRVVLAPKSMYARLEICPNPRI